MQILYFCVPTPSNKDGSCNTSIVENILYELHEIKFKGIICIRSSTEPGFTERSLKNLKIIKSVLYQNF